MSTSGMWWPNLRSRCHSCESGACHQTCKWCLKSRYRKTRQTTSSLPSVATVALASQVRPSHPWSRHHRPTTDQFGIKQPPQTIKPTTKCQVTSNSHAITWQINKQSITWPQQPQHPPTFTAPSSTTFMSPSSPLSNFTSALSHFLALPASSPHPNHRDSQNSLHMASVYGFITF
jgi:hypothetical protein